AFGNAALTATAYLVESNTEQRRDQSEARNEREDQGQETVVKGEPADQHPGNGVDEAEEDHIGAAGLEIGSAGSDRSAQIGEPNAAHYWWCRFVSIPGAGHGVGRRTDGLPGLL